MPDLGERRSLAAKKAWRTRRRMAKPSAAMRVWLLWLSRRPGNAILQRFHSRIGTLFSFGAYPHDAVASCDCPRFNRAIFHALKRRKWVVEIHRSETSPCGQTLEVDGSTTNHYGHYAVWKISEAGRRMVVTTKGQPNVHEPCSGSTE